MDKVQSMVSSKVTWHRKENLVEEKMTSQEAFVWSKQAEMNLQMLPITANGKVSEDHAALFEMNSNTWVATHGVGYSPANPWELYEFFAPVIEKAGGKYINAIVMDDYQKILSLADFGDRFTYNVGKAGTDNPVKKFFLSGIGYDGTMGQFWGDVDTEVVCDNTLGIALRESNNHIGKYRQTKNRRANIMSDLSAETILAMMEADVEAQKENCGIMVNTQYSPEQLKKFMEVMFPKVKAGKEELTPKVVENRGMFMQALEIAPGIQAGQTQGSFFSFVDALTFMVANMGFGRREKTSLAQYDLFGGANALRAKAFDTIWKLM